MAGLQIKTEGGFTCTVHEEALDDMRVFENLVVMDDSKAGVMDQLKATLNVVKALIGEDGKESLYAFIEEKEGRVKVETVGKMIVEIFNAVGESGKK